MSEYMKTDGPSVNEALSNITSDARIEIREPKAVEAVTFKRDDNRVVVDGIPMTREQYEGLFGKTAPQTLMGEAAPKVAMDSDMARTVAPPSEPKVIDQDIDNATAQDISSQMVFDTVVGTAQLSLGWEPDATEQFATDYMNGEIANDDVLWTGMAQKGLRLENVEQMRKSLQVSQQNVARSELGDAAYAELGRLADQSKSIRGLVVKHALNRAGGKSRVPYTEVLKLAREFAGR